MFVRPYVCLQISVLLSISSGGIIFLASKGLSLTMSGPVWKVAVYKNFDFQSFAICQNFRKNMNEDVHNLPDDEPSIFFDVHMRL